MHVDLPGLSGRSRPSSPTAEVEAGVEPPKQRAGWAAPLLGSGEPASASKLAEHVPTGGTPPAAAGHVRAYVTG